MANAAKRVGRTETIELSDGREVVLRPLNIKTLKKFMKKFRELQSDFDEKLTPEEVEEQIIDILVDCAAISLSSQLKEETAYLVNPEESREDFESLVDQDTVEFINEICGGIVMRVNGAAGDDEDLQLTGEASR
jgi:predicted lipase